MKQEIISHRIGFPGDGRKKLRVLIVEGGADDGAVVVEDDEGLTLNAHGEVLELDDCTLRQVPGEHDSFEDAATVALFIGEREDLIRKACELAQSRHKMMTVEWHGVEVAHALACGGFVRVEDLKGRVAL